MSYYLKRDARISCFTLISISIFIFIPNICFASTAGNIDGIGDTDLKDSITALQVCAGGFNDVYIQNEISDDGKIGLEEAVYALQVVSGMRQTQKIWYKDSDGDKHSDGTRIISATRPSDIYFEEENLLAISGDPDDADESFDYNNNIFINENNVFQVIEGFGASFTDSSAYLFARKLTDDKREKAMMELFDPDIGIGLSFLRQPMGASDFIAFPNSTYYTYNDMPEGEEDLSLEKFSIELDERYIIDILRQAYAINPGIKFMGTPWSAPAWMKDSGKLTEGVLRDDLHGVYAEYFLKYVQSYANHGINIHAVTLQNEPGVENRDYPVMKMEIADQIKLAKSIGKTFDDNSVDTKIFAWDHNWEWHDSSGPNDMLNDESVRNYIDGIAFHCYAGEPSKQKEVYESHPDKEIYLTECSGWGEPNFRANLIWDTKNLIIDSIRFGSSVVLKWNMALDENHGPKGEGDVCTNCRGVITINQQTGEYVKNEEYFSLGHASKFVKPGAKRIESTENRFKNVAFLNLDKSIVLIVLNQENYKRTVGVNWRNRFFSYELFGESVTTFKWNDNIYSKISLWITTGDKEKLLDKQEDIRFEDN